jgi:hypothetical protein
LGVVAAGAVDVVRRVRIGKKYAFFDGHGGYGMCDEEQGRGDHAENLEVGAAEEWENSGERKIAAVKKLAMEFHMRPQLEELTRRIRRRCRY